VEGSTRRGGVDGGADAGDAIRVEATAARWTGCR